MWRKKNLNPSYITMVATATGTALYKKRAGTLSVLEDTTPAKLYWKCIDPDVPDPLVEVPLDDIVNLKVTPANSKMMMIKIGLAPGSASAHKYENKKHKSDILFSFTLRQTMDAVKDALQVIITRKKARVLDQAQPTTPQPSTISGSNASNDEMLASLLDEKSLLKNLTLQQKLLRESPALMQTFTESVIKSGLEPEEFWSTRVHLLRSYAIQYNQKRGPYNVLSTIKPVASSDNQVNVSVTREKIHEIFKQYPIVRKAYDDSVPKISEGEFWSRFFSSKLFRKLRGEKINIYDRGDITLDKYLYYDADYDGEEEDEDVDKLLEDGGDKKRHEPDKHLTASKKKVKLFRDQVVKVPKGIDLLANDENSPEVKGNAPDITMKPDQDPYLVNVVRTMNRLSRRMMTNVEDTESQTDLDDAFAKELDLRDLDDRQDVEYNELNYTQRSNVSTTIVPPNVLKKAMTQSNLDPDQNEYDKLISDLKKQIDQNNKLDLTSVYLNVSKPIYDAYKDVTSIVKKSSKQSSQSWCVNTTDALSTNDVKDAQNEVPKDRLESLRLTHSTSIEFLRHFWLHFNSIATSTSSSNPNFRKELVQLRKSYTSINKCLERVQSNLAVSTGEEHETEQRMIQPLVDSLQQALNSYEAAIIEPKH